MSYLILEHLKAEDLPPAWARRLPVGQTFTVTIVSENPLSRQPSLISKPRTGKTPLAGIWRDNPATQDVDRYVRQLRKGRFDAD